MTRHTLQPYVLSVVLYIYAGLRLAELEEEKKYLIEQSSKLNLFNQSLSAVSLSRQNSRQDSSEGSENKEKEKEKEEETNDEEEWYIYIHIYMYSNNT